MFARYNSMTENSTPWPSFENEEKKGQTVADDHSSGRGLSVYKPRFRLAPDYGTLYNSGASGIVS